ncbi:argonaute-like protein [Flagelloscypha sp. PMI_526]|nr:argonaute-like protein [Flagelloscypha sp. PMI_526]
MSGRGRGGRGTSHGSRSGPPRGSAASSATAQPGAPQIASHVSTIGVKRSDFGRVGRVIPVLVNSFETTIPDGTIFHYDVISPTEKNLPARLNMEIIETLQTSIAPQTFTPRAVYDGRKNVFAPRQLPNFEFTADGKESREFTVTLGDPVRVTKSGKGPKAYKVKLTLVATINPETLSRFIAGEQSHDNSVLTAITALNVVIRMQPSLRFPFNVRSFFTNQETSDIGMGIVLWRGYFQSVRPAIGKMLINVDISTGAMYKPGPLISLCLDYLGKPGQNPNLLAPRAGLPDRQRLQLMRFISGIKVLIPNAEGKMIPRIVKKLSQAGASVLSFSLREGGTQTVAKYFAQTQNKPLKFPDVLCVEVGNGALIPLEMCTVPPGQIIRKQVPPEKTKDVLEFATKKPSERLASIKRGVQILAYGQSEYVRQFSMRVKDSTPLQLQARVLTPPSLTYGPGSKQRTVVPQKGSWNMIGQRFYQACLPIKSWCVAVYERENRFRHDACRDMIEGFVAACQSVGIQIQPTKVVRYQNAQGNIYDQLKAIGLECKNLYGAPPTLIVVIIPEGGNDTYTAVKNFGDCRMGVATQCLKSSKCFRAKPQYYANVCLKVNVKLGGINVIPQAESVKILTDDKVPTILLGADVVHPAPGADGRPSFTSLVGNIDSNAAKYIAVSNCQTSRQEMMDDLTGMVKTIITKFMAYRKQVEKVHPNLTQPKRIIFYRDGVSEGQFAQVLGQELPRIQAACRELDIRPMPLITIVVVGKRHHMRIFPANPGDADKSGNAPAGTVIDQHIGHPTEMDFFLQSHGGLLGTSRPAHYSVLYDENNFTADGIQQLSFALCHVYARSTRSVSIPAPVYYADIVAARAKNHYDPEASVAFSDSMTQDSQEAGQSLDSFRRNFMPVHPNQANLMFFS